MKSLNERMLHSFRVFGRRNRLFLGSTSDRIRFLGFAIGDLQDAIRKGADRDFQARLLSRILSRIFCCVEQYCELPFLETACRKYPLTKCGYCGHAPCDCGDRRKAVTLLPVADEVQLRWTLGDWCRESKKVYGPRNAEKGLENTVLRLYKEVTELDQIDALIPGFRGTMRELEEKIAEELADTMLWTIAVANLFDIDLDLVMEDRYGKGCRKCTLSVCACTHFDKRQVYANSTVVQS